MAATNSIEELLSSEVDENEVSALVGTLESRLASPTHKESSQDVSDSVVVPITAPATTDRVGSNGNTGATSNSNVGATKSTGNTTGIGVTGTNHINNTATSCVGVNLGIGTATAPTIVTVAASSQPASSTVSAPFASIQAVSQGQKGIPLVTAGGPQMNKNTAPISKAPMDTQIIGISSILSSTNATVTGTGAGGVVGTGSPACGVTTVPGASGVSLLNVNTPNTVQIPTNSGKIGNTQTIRIITQTSSVANTNNSNPNVPYVHPIARPLGPTQPQPVQHQVVTTDSNGAITAVQKNTATSGVVTNQTNQTTNSAIYNLATIAAERKPLMVPHMTVQQTKSMQTANRMTVREQIDQRQDKTGGQKITTTTTTTPPVTSTPIMKPDQSTGHFVIKDTTRNITTSSPKTEITCSRDTMARVTSSVVTSTQQNLQNVHIVKGLSQQVNPNVITVSRTQPQGVSMVQPQILNNATQMRIVTLNNQNIHTSRALTVNAGSLGKTTNNRVGTVRINTSQPSPQINIAPRPGGTNAITLPTSIQLQPGTVLVKNEQGQLVLVHASQSSVLQPQTSTNTTVLPGKLQNVKTMCNQGQPRQPTSTPTILTIQQPQGQATTSSHHTVLRQTVPVNHNPVQVSPVSQNSTGSTTTMPSTISVGHNQATNVLPNQNSNMIDNVRKCKNFMATLLKLASNQRPETILNVRELIQGLIDGKVDPESFTEKLQIELQSSPQPCLVPFLKKSLPLLRHSLYMNKMSIDGVRPPPPEVIRGQTMCSVPNTTVMTHTKQNVHSHTHNRMTHVTSANRMTTQPQVHGVMSGGHLHQPTQTIINKVCSAGQIGHVQVRGGQAKMTTTTVGHPGITVTKSNLGTMTTVGRTNLLNTLPTSTTNLQSHMQIKKETLAPHKEKRKYESLKDDDDINDVATMGGVNLSEETRNIMATNAEFIGTQIRSCKDECFLYHSPLLSRISSIAKKYGVEEVPSDVANIISHATQERLRDFIEKLSTIAEHRTEIYKMDSRYEVRNDVRAILKHFEELERLEKKRHEEQEREMLLRVAKSRSKHEDPEQLKLKQKAKELQLAEMEEMRQREANITALAAIGPRKKRKTEAGDPNQSGTSTSLTNGGVSSSSVRPVVSRPRIKRVNLRDLLFLMEQDKSLCRSTLMYKSFFK